MTLASTGGKTGSNSRSNAGSKTGPKTGLKKGLTTGRGRGFRSAAETARRRLGEAAAGHGFAEPEVLMRWPEVVGERLSGLCEPVKVSYPRTQGVGSRGLSATLLVRAEGARATEVEHLGPRIIERVNQFYGYRAIGEMKVTQTTGWGGPGGFAEEPARFAGRPSAAPAEPGPEARARAAEMASGIQNEALRAALTRMGAHVLSRGDPPEKS
jgi:hypothetical protein